MPRGKSDEMITVTMLRKDAMILVLGPLDAAMAMQRGELEKDASVKRLRQTVYAVLEARGDL